jgi:hypothetical protein
MTTQHTKTYPIHKYTQAYLDELAPLVDGTIVGLVVDTSAGDTWHDQFFGLRIRKPNGEHVALFLMRDDEGNGPGAFSIETLKEGD